MKNIFYLLAFSLVSMTTTLFAQLTPRQAIEEMGRGINLGNTLEPPLEGAWNNGPAQESFFDAYAEAGFTNVRIPVRWDQHTANAAPFAIDAEWMDRVEQVVDWGLERGLYITMNGHHEDWLKTGYSNATLRSRYDAIWTQVADRFKDKSEKLLFEVINEPKGLTVAEINDLNERILGIIRVNNPTRIVIFGGNEYANSAELLNTNPPDDDYLIGYYHAYDPWPFSGMGIGTWGTPDDYRELTLKFISVAAWANNRDIPVHLSEFGAIHDCDYNSRMRIYAHNVEQSIDKGFAFSAWDDGGNFGILNRRDNTWPEVKDILAYYHVDSPNDIFSNVVLSPATNQTTIVVDWNNRATDNGNIILQRSVGIDNPFVQIAELPADANTYTDLDIQGGKTYTYRMYTTRADGTLLHGYPTRTEVIATTQTPFNTSEIEIPGVLEVEEYDNGGEGLAYHDLEPQNLPGGFRTGEGVDIGPLGTGFILEYVANEEWIEYTVNVTQAGVYTVVASAGSEQANGTFELSFDKNDARTDFTVPSTGDWKVFTNVTANREITLEEGIQEMRLSITNNTPFNVDHLTFSLGTTSIPELEANRAGFKVSPNPTDGNLNINLSETLLKQANQLEIFTLSGKKVSQLNLTSASSSIDLNDFQSGIYLLRLIGDNVNLVQRVEVIK